MTSPDQTHDSSHRLRRRDVLAAMTLGPLATGLAGIWPRAARAIDIEAPPAEAKWLTAYENQKQVFVRRNNSVVVTYRASDSQKFPYFSPLLGPASGVPLTTESSLPYPHHRGVWLGCEPLNGGDYWSDNSHGVGRIASAGPTLVEANQTSAVIHDRCAWLRSDAPSPCEDRRRFVVCFPSPEVVLLDIEIDLIARTDIQIDSAKHSFFALRAAPDITPINGGALVNSDGGLNAAGTYGRPAAWCGYHGPREQSRIVEGIALFNHPDNFGGDCPWFTRNYGHLSPSPFYFLQKPWRLERGATLSLKYCVVLHAGTPQEIGLDKIYQEWTAGSGRFVAIRSRRNFAELPAN